MALVVVGGHSRNIGKTSVVAGLIAALPEFGWTAAKITQYGHGVCSANGKACDCATGDHSWAITEETNRTGTSDSARFLGAGAVRSLWVRTERGRLAEAMPELRRRLACAQNVILESNSILRFMRPDLYLVVLDYTIPDFKESARTFLDRADALVFHQSASPPAWQGISHKLITGKPAFAIRQREYVTPELVSFVRAKLAS